MAPSAGGIRQTRRFSLRRATQGLYTSRGITRASGPMITLLRVLFGFIVACLVAGVGDRRLRRHPGRYRRPAGRSADRAARQRRRPVAAGRHALGHLRLPVRHHRHRHRRAVPLRSWIYYVLVGIAIALGGLAAEYAAEVPGPAVDHQRLRAGRIPRRRRRRAALPTGWSPDAAPAASAPMPRRRRPRAPPADPEPVAQAT